MLADTPFPAVFYDVVGIPATTHAPQSRLRPEDVEGTARSDPGVSTRSSEGRGERRRVCLDAVGLRRAPPSDSDRRRELRPAPRSGQHDVGPPRGRVRCRLPRFAAATRNPDRRAAAAIDPRHRPNTRPHDRESRARGPAGSFPGRRHRWIVGLGHPQRRRRRGDRRSAPRPSARDPSCAREPLHRERHRGARRIGRIVVPTGRFRTTDATVVGGRRPAGRPRGASTVHEVAATGVPAILVPWAGAAEDHQTENVAWLSEHGAAVLLPETRAGELPATIQRLRIDQVTRRALGERAFELGEVHRSGALAQLVESVALA